MAYVQDNFQRANGALGGSWSTPKVPSPNGKGTGTIQIVNNGFAPSVAAGANFCSSVWNGQNFGNDQRAQAVLNNTPTNKSIVHITALQLGSRNFDIYVHANFGCGSIHWPTNLYFWND